MPGKLYPALNSVFETLCLDKIQDQIVDNRQNKFSIAFRHRGCIFMKGE